MSAVVIYDACVLYPSTLRDVLMEIAQIGLVQAKWSDQILDETFRNLKEDRPDLDPAKLDRTRALMARAVRDCLVKGHEPLVDVMDLPDPDDRHVLAAAVRAKAQAIVTFNLKDFPAEACRPGASRLCTRTPSSRRRSTSARKSCTHHSNASPEDGSSHPRLRRRT